MSRAIEEQSRLWQCAPEVAVVLGLHDVIKVVCYRLGKHFDWKARTTEGQVAVLYEALLMYVDVVCGFNVQFGDAIYGSLHPFRIISCSVEAVVDQGRHACVASLVVIPRIYH